jgi:hypothetical protein
VHGLESHRKPSEAILVAPKHRVCSILYANFREHLFQDVGE